jgi:hypothetical protein
MSGSSPRRFLTPLSHRPLIPFNNQQSSILDHHSFSPMKRLSLFALALSLSACSVDWQKAAIAATNAAAPVVLDGLNAKQPKNVQP